MQIISRRLNEGILIGAQTQITVLEIDEDSVELEIRSSRDGDDDRRVVRLYVAHEVDVLANDDSHYEMTALAGAR